MPDLPDAELLRAARTDAEAFEALYDRYLDRVFAFVASRVRCRADAEDFTSEVWMRVLKSLPRFQWRHEASVPAWIFRIARNVLIDADRRRTARGGEGIDLDDIVDLVPDPAANPAEITHRRMRFQDAQRLVDGLPPQQGRCIRLRFYGGLRNNEIARVEGLSEKTVAAHVSRALAALRLASDQPSPSRHDA